jgi:hypothetical protein
LAKAWRVSRRSRGLPPAPDAQDFGQDLTRSSRSGRRSNFKTADKVGIYVVNEFLTHGSSLVKEAPAQPLNTPGRAAIAEAARALARMRCDAIKKAGPDTRRWTGRVFGKRAFIGQAVVLDGEICWIKQVLRGWACVRTSQVDPIDGPVHTYCPVASLRRFRSPAAVLLGKRKLGVREAKSAAKAASSRRNGTMPKRINSTRFAPAVAPPLSRSPPASQGPAHAPGLWAAWAEAPGRACPRICRTWGRRARQIRRTLRHQQP